MDNGRSWTRQLEITPRSPSVYGQTNNGSFLYSCLVPDPLKAEPGLGGLLYSHHDAYVQCWPPAKPCDANHSRMLALFTRFPLDF